MDNSTKSSLDNYNQIERNIFMTFSILTTLLVFCGNSLVVAAVATKKRLQTVTNMYVVSLAVADLLVAVLVLPPSIGYYYTKKWVFNSGLTCIAWLSADILLSTASIYNLIVISIDRYMAVTSPLEYIARRTKTRALVMIIFAWVLSFFLVLPPLIGMKQHNSSDGNCDITNDKLFRIISSSSTFYIPFVIMVYLYTKIFIVSYQRFSLIKKNFPNLAVMSSSSSCGGHGVNAYKHNRMNNYLGNHKGKQTQRTFCKEESLKMKANKSRNLNVFQKFLACKNLMRKKTSVEEDNGKIIQIHRKNRKVQKRNPKKMRKKRGSRQATELLILPEFPESVEKTKLTDLKVFRLEDEQSDYDDPNTDESVEKTHLTTNEGVHIKSYRSTSISLRDEKSKERAAFQRENKTAITLAYVVGCFSICWFPFFIVYVLEPWLSVEVPRLIMLIFTWLGYSNSVFNPFIYAFYNKEYANAFKGFLRLN